jgi:hypothetical protein
VHLALVGSNPPDRVMALRGEGVEVTGFVSDEELAARYAGARVVTAPLRDTANPAVRAKRPPVVGSTTGVFVNRLNAPGEITSTGRVPRCSWPEVGSGETR